MNIRRIPLGNGEFVTVDEDMYEELSKHNWNCNSRGYVFRWVNSGVRKDKKTGNLVKKYKPSYMQKEIMGTKKGEIIYIEDRNLLNLVRSNMTVTTRVNLSHHIGRNTARSKYMGVYFNKGNKKWLAYISHSGQLFYLGAFLKDIDAALVRDFYSRKYYGDKAFINVTDQQLKTQNEVDKLVALSSTKTNRYIGVTKVTKKLWRARLTHDGNNYDLGLFKSDIEAAQARDKKVIELGLPVKKMNFINIK